MRRIYEKIIFCLIFVFTTNGFIFSFDYLDFKEYVGKNIQIAQAILPNLKCLDGLSNINNIENLLISYAANLSDDNNYHFVVFDVVNDIIKGYIFSIDFNDQYLAKTTYEKYKNENLASEFSIMVDDTPDQYQWMNFDYQIISIKIKEYDGVFSVIFNYSLY